MLIPHGALILVMDGGGLRLLRNRGQESSLDLHVIEERSFHNPPGRMLVSDAPGRSFESKGPTRHAYDAADHHEQREAHFAKEAVALLRDEMKANIAVVVIAPPRMLGELRAHIDRRISDRVIGEIDKDLSSYRTEEIAAYLYEAR